MEQMIAVGAFLGGLGLLLLSFGVFWLGSLYKESIKSAK